MQIYEVSITKVEAMEQLIRKYMKNWWSKKFTINKRKMVSEEIHHLEEVKCVATAVGQRKQGAWTKLENAKDRAVTWDPKN